MSLRSSRRGVTSKSPSISWRSSEARTQRSQPSVSDGHISGPSWQNSRPHAPRSQTCDALCGGLWRYRRSCASAGKLRPEAPFYVAFLLFLPEQGFYVMTAQKLTAPRCGAASFPELLPSSLSPWGAASSEEGLARRMLRQQGQHQRSRPPELPSPPRSRRSSRAPSVDP